MDGEPERLVVLFAAAAALPPTEREAWLDSECAGRPDLRSEVESLLAAHERSGDFLDRLDAHAARALLSEPGEEPPPATLEAGRWRVLREIGRGGMGVVYLAERAEGGFEQQVALKVLALGAGSEAIQRRFLAERQILARLEHPNVARLVDGGVTADGRPFFALEYVDGEPVVAWCDRRRLGVEGRLGLFLRICAAVQYAHANLIVHRDLKPSNILVTPAGEPKLLDFGIAKLIDAAASEGAATTATGSAALTPEYASPEQLRGEPVTTASDVFSLAVVLYELLAGRRPRRIKRGAFGVLAPAPIDEPVAPPSVVLAPAVRGAGSDAVERVDPVALAAARGTTPADLRRRLAGDLDAVVMRALRPEPERRYPSIDAFASDLRRHLAGGTVEAGRGTLAYRSGKFVRRHRLSVAAAAAVALALAAGVVAAAWQAARAAREARRARAVQGFLVEIFERADPSRSLGESVTARALLDEGARRLAAEAGAEVAIRAELADTLARSYLGLGRLDAASSWSARATEDFTRALGGDHPRTALAELTVAEVRASRGEVAPARAALDALEPRLREAFGEASPEHLRVRSARALLLVHTGDFEPALAEHRAVFAATRARLGDDHPDTVGELIDVGVALAETSRFAESEAALRDALDRLVRIRGARSPQWVTLHNNLGDLLERVGRRAEAETAFNVALATGREVLGPRHPIVAQTLIKQGFLFGLLGRRAESQAALNEAIAILEPIGHYDAGSALRYLGYDYQRVERYEAARDAFARAEALLRAKLGDDSPMTWSSVVTTAFADAKLGRLADAQRRLREAVAALERHHGAESDDVRAPKKYLGEVLRLAGRYEEAERLHRWSLDLERRLFGGDATLASASTKNQIALDLLESGRPGRFDEARRLADESIAFFRSQPGDPTRLGDSLLTGGRIAAAQGAGARARRELDEAVSLLEPERGPDAPSVLAARRALATLSR